ncbi:glycoside hydrolase family 16 protein [Dothistroma septosporum NZE10]|uniref:Crh-like protein n=1 Tax=Dothistroma septosporum (strain NZE10 / CBS 128990) TaxID=675120 RepID=N1Q0H8_DOTSN|nr:glycoside hydrolase family 16 protein [Dothistroma septosporum NZE10]
MRFSQTTLTGAVFAASLPLIQGQTSTDCNPTTNTSCPADTGLSTSTYSADFTQGASANASWSAAAYTSIDYDDSDGAIFTIAKSGEAPTIQTDFYIFFGRVDVVMKAAPGTGIVSSVVLESADLDEIDWEFLGGSDGQVQSNFFGKGNTTNYNRVQYHNVADTQDTWHTYSIDWSKERIEYIIDGTTVRTLEYSSSLALDGQNYPQTPMQLKLGSWAGGDSSNEGTVEWAGGKTDYTKAPFTMYVKSVKITNSNPACSYEYGDMTGSYESIKLISSGDSCEAGSSSSSASGSGSASASATAAPTSSHVVEALSNTKVAVSTTISGSAYSTNTASISAINAGTTTAAAATTGVASQPTAGVNGSVASSSPSASASYGAAASSQYIVGWAAILSLVSAIFLL